MISGTFEEKKFEQRARDMRNLSPWHAASALAAPCMEGVDFGEAKAS